MRCPKELLNVDFGLKFLSHTLSLIRLLYFPPKDYSDLKRALSILILALDRWTQGVTTESWSSLWMQCIEFGSTKHQFIFHLTYVERNLWFYCLGVECEGKQRLNNMCLTIPSMSNQMIIDPMKTTIGFRVHQLPSESQPSLSYLHLSVAEIW